MENGKFLNIGPLDRKEYIIEQFHIRKEQNQNHIYVLRLSLVFHTLKKELSIPFSKCEKLVIIAKYKYDFDHVPFLCGTVR